MASLRETKDRIGSVKSTLKITSAMKLVASSKLRKAQNAIEALRPYEDAFRSILRSVMASGAAGRFSGPRSPFSESDGAASEVARGSDGDGKVAIVAIASNSSLCGGFNANAVRRVSEIVSGKSDFSFVDEPGNSKENAGVVVFSIGRKMADAMKIAGYPSPKDYSGLSAHPSYEEAGRLASELCEGFCKGRYSRVVLVYNHFVSTAKQTVVAETFLPSADIGRNSIEKGNNVEELVRTEKYSSSDVKDSEYFIVEPSAGEIAEKLFPEMLKLQLYAAVLDSAAAEHAARTVAMQTATDNAQELLADLTLEYNKGRQQKITAEILDLVGGRQ